MDNYSFETYNAEIQKRLTKLDEQGYGEFLTLLTASLISAQVFYVNKIDDNYDLYKKSSDFLQFYSQFGYHQDNLWYYDQKTTDGEVFDDEDYDDYIMSLSFMVKAVADNMQTVVTLSAYSPNFIGRNVDENIQDFLDSLEMLHDGEGEILAENANKIILEENNTNHLYNDCIDADVLPLDTNFMRDYIINFVKDVQNGLNENNRSDIFLYTPLIYGIKEHQTDVYPYREVFLTNLYNILTYEYKSKEMDVEEIKHYSDSYISEVYEGHMNYIVILQEVECLLGVFKSLIPLDDINRVRGPLFRLNMKAENGRLVCSPKVLDNNLFYNLTHDLNKTEEYVEFIEKSNKN